jgi:hypothetical protein
MSKTRKMHRSANRIALTHAARLAAASLLAALWLAAPLPAQDTPATLVVKNEVSRTHRVKVTPSNGAEAETEILQQGAKHTFTIAHGESCADQSVKIEFRFVQGVVNRVDASATLPLAAEQTVDENGEPRCTLLVKKPIDIFERAYDNYLRWTKLEASKGRIIFAIRYGL